MQKILDEDIAILKLNEDTVKMLKENKIIRKRKREYRKL